MPEGAYFLEYFVKEIAYYARIARLWDFFFEKLHATLDSQVPVFLGFLSPEGD